MIGKKIAYKSSSLENSVAEILACNKNFTQPLQTSRTVLFRVTFCFDGNCGCTVHGTWYVASVTEQPTIVSAINIEQLVKTKSFHVSIHIIGLTSQDCPDPAQKIVSLGKQ